MNEPVYDEYVAIIMSLILFSQRMERIIPQTELNQVDKAIDVLRYWAHFLKKRQKGGM